MSSYPMGIIGLNRGSKGNARLLMIVSLDLINVIRRFWVAYQDPKIFEFLEVFRSFCVDGISIGISA